MKFLKLIILFLLVKFPNSSCTLLTEKAAFFANSVFKEFITSVVWWHDKPDDVTDFIKLFQGCVVVVPVQDNETSKQIIQQFNIQKKFMQTVFFTSDIHEVEYFMTLLYQDVVIPIRMIVVLTKPATHSELSELMKIAWYNDVTDILVVGSNNGEVLLTTYFPYRHGKCGDFTPVHLKHDIKELFPKKFRNFHGCEIKTSLLQLKPYSRLKFENNTLVSFSGIDGNILHILCDVLNASIRVVSANDHGGFGTIVNGTPTGSIADLVSKKADILLPGLMMNIVRYQYVQFSHPFETADIIWFGPPRREIGEGLRVLQPFLSNLTLALFISSIVFIAVTIVVRRFVHHSSISSQSIPFQTFIIFLGFEIKFGTKSSITTCLFVMWIWFCMVVRIAYQGDLVDGLQKTALETPLRSFESAAELVDGFGGLEGLAAFFYGTQYYHRYKIISLRNISEYLKDVEAGKRFLIVTELQIGLDSAPNIQILDDDPLTSGPVSLCVRPGWPAIADFNDAIIQMIEKGFVAKVFKEHAWEWIKAVEKKDDREAKPITLETLIGCFYGLGVMYAICTLVLVVEILYHRMEVNKKKHSTNKT